MDNNPEKNLQKERDQLAREVFYLKKLTHGQTKALEKDKSPVKQYDKMTKMTM